MPNKKVTVTKNYIESLKRDLKRTKEELAEVQQDRKLFREYFLTLLKENISMSSKNHYYPATTMIEQLSKLMNRVKPWYWG